MGPPFVPATPCGPTPPDADVEIAGGDETLTETTFPDADAEITLLWTVAVMLTLAPRLFR